MFRTLFALLLILVVRSIEADEKQATITFLGGEKKIPLEGLTVSIRAYTGDWSIDRDGKILCKSQTDCKGSVTFSLAPNWYYVDVVSAKEIPYLPLPMGYKSHPSIYGRMIKVEQAAQQSFDFNLADACKLILRAVDDETGQGIPHVNFVTENALGELWGIPILGDNLGAASGEKAEKECANQEGYFTRYIGPREGYTYFGWQPQGYEIVGTFEITLDSSLGTKQVEHVFRYKKK